VRVSEWRSSAGLALIELMVALALTGIVLGSVCQILVDNQRFYRSTSQILDVQQGIRAVAQLLPGELRQVDAAAGDIMAMGPDSITIKALRNTYFICAPPVPAAGTIIIRNDLIFGYREVDATRDRALVFRDGDTRSTGDDAWLDLAISSTSAGATCSDDSGAGTTMTLTGTISKLDSVTVGSPVRTYERITYRLYADAEGIGWLGVRNFVNGSWSSISPIAGPLQGTNGITLTYYDSTGTVTAAPTSVAQIGVVVRGISVAPIRIPGRRANLLKYQDSMATRVTMRNNP
jgi:hypothetical protein